MSSVTINPPKTPVTKGSKGIARATVPNVCKMPGPPAPFVPAPLPNIGKSSDSPQGYSKTVTIEGNAVAIKGATFKSMGDMASKGTGGGLISANTHGITKFVGPGSMNVKIEGKNVQLLSDPMLNNCGPSGSPPNSATMTGIDQPDGEGGDVGAAGKVHVIDCDIKGSAKKNWDCCQLKQFCAKVAAVNEQTLAKQTTRDPAKIMKRDSKNGEGKFRTDWREDRTQPVFQPIESKFYHPCAQAKAASEDFKMESSSWEPDHVHEIQLGGHPTNFSNLKWLDKSVNKSLGPTMSGFKPADTPGGIVADCCPAEEKSCKGRKDGEKCYP